MECFGSAPTGAADCVAANPKEKKEMMETIAQEYIDKGIEQGKQEGMEEEREVIAKNMLLSGLSVALICQVTGLSKQAIAKLSRL